MVNVNKAAWDKLDKGIQDKVLNIAAEMEAKMWDMAAEMDRTSREKLTQNGMTIVEVSPEFRAELDKVGETLRSVWAQKAGADAQKILDEYNKRTGR